MFLAIKLKCKLFYFAILLSIPRKINPCIGSREYQYNLPNKPSGLKVAVWVSLLLLSILNSSQASPGSFISAYNNRRFSCLSAKSTRQKSEHRPKIFLFHFFSLFAYQHLQPFDLRCL